MSRLTTSILKTSLGPRCRACARERESCGEKMADGEIALTGTAALNSWYGFRTLGPKHLMPFARSAGSGPNCSACGISNECPISAASSSPQAGHRVATTLCAESATPMTQGPTVALVGGRMTVDDGSILDSRQQVEGDPESRVTRNSLANSLLWWTTTSSLVEPLLDTTGAESFALVIGPRSVVELRHDGTLRRTRLRSLLRGGTSTVELVRTSVDEPLPDGYDEVTTIRASNGQSLGTVGISPGPAGRRWRFLDGNEY